jgi:hypothetical protein
MSPRIGDSNGVSEAVPGIEVPTLPVGLPDGWVFDRDLYCPTCRYNLRMLHMPRCPECGTVFRWQGLLHIGCPRCGHSLEVVDADACPACGLALNWERLLAEADPARLRQFEYTRHPFRAAWRTWLAALRPRRFWRGISLETPPAVRRLRWLRRAGIATCVGAFAAMHWGQASGLSAALGLLPIYALVLLLPVVTMLGLPRFTPTLTRFRIRRDQLLRCFAYGSAGVFWTGLLLFLALAITLVVNAVWPVTVIAGGATYQAPRLAAYPPLALGCLEHPQLLSSGIAACMWFNIVLTAAIAYFSFAWWWPFLWAALTTFLQLNRRNALALFLSTQFIGLLAIMIILIRYSELGIIIGHLLNRIL